MEKTKRLEKFVNTLSRIHKFNVVSTYPEVKKLAQIIIDMVAEVVDAQISFLMISDPDKEKIELAAAKGLNPEAIQHFSPQGEHLNEVISKEIYLLIGDIQRDKRFEKAGDFLEGVKSLVGIPLWIKEENVGALVVASPEQDFFDKQSVDILKLVAEHTVIALENVFLRQQAQRIYLETIHTLARAMEAKDKYVAGHSNRVALYATTVARKLGLPFEQVRDIGYAALIHDIGKIGVDEKILLKPGKLTDDEYTAVKSHPMIGDRIIAPVEFLHKVAPLILYHHEWYNGKGYLEGLKGEQIPIGARIIAICDAYDAMVSDRPYRKALSKKEAKQELIKGKETQFDSKLVDMFLELVEKNEFAEKAEVVKI